MVFLQFPWVHRPWNTLHSFTSGEKDLKFISQRCQNISVSVFIVYMFIWQYYPDSLRLALELALKTTSSKLQKKLNIIWPFFWPLQIELYSLASFPLWIAWQSDSVTLVIQGSTKQMYTLMVSQSTMDKNLHNQWLENHWYLCRMACQSEYLLCWRSHALWDRWLCTQVSLVWDTPRSRYPRQHPLNSSTCPHGIFLATARHTHPRATSGSTAHYAYLEMIQS